jgi:hypothetical protein
MYWKCTSTRVKVFKTVCLVFSVRVKLSASHDKAANETNTGWTEVAWKQGAKGNVWTLEWKKATGGCRKLHNEKLYGVHFSPYVITVIIHRRKLWGGHVACMQEVRNALKILVEMAQGWDHFKIPGNKSALHLHKEIKIRLSLWSVWHSAVHKIVLLLAI